MPDTSLPPSQPPSPEPQPDPSDPSEQPDRIGVFLDMRAHRVLVVGGGRVSRRRIARLLEAGAEVVLVAPDADQQVRDWAESGRIEWRRREYRSDDLSPEPAHTGRADEPGGTDDPGATDEAAAPDRIDHAGGSARTADRRFWLVHTATGTPADVEVAADAERAGIWCIRADSAAESPATIGAAATGPDGIRVAVSSGDPRRSRSIAAAVTGALSTGALPLRRQRPQGGSGWVALVGGGPGEVGLLTLRGRQLLGMADVVVTDRLGPVTVLDELDDDVRIIDVGKRPGFHRVPQEQINQILVDEARARNRVVRLKGGDPFVLGRGGEEAIFCQEHGVAVEWVPGVTSAISVPAAAGIPVTHRATSPAFIVASGHESSQIAAATPPETTVLLLMGVLRIADTVDLLLAGGRGPDTPVAIIERGWTPRQRVTRTLLADCARTVADAGIRPPAVVVIGPVAAMADMLGPVGEVVPR